MMIERKEIPLFEFDPCQIAFINPENDYDEQVIPELSAKVGVICFFRDAIEAYIKENECEKVLDIKTETIYLPIYLDKKKNVLLVQGFVGGPVAACEVEALAFLGASKVITCGGAGVISELGFGHLMLPTSAIRDEGTSYHYAPASYEIAPSLPLVDEIADGLAKRKLPFVKGKTWTTDAPFRETKEKVALRREEGALCVEMECASFYAVGSFRNVQVASVLYGGDSLEGDEWDHREWNKKTNMRLSLLNVVMDIASHV